MHCEIIRWQAIPVNDSSRPEAVFVHVTGWLKWDKFQWMRYALIFGED